MISYENKYYRIYLLSNQHLLYPNSGRIKFEDEKISSMQYVIIEIKKGHPQAYTEYLMNFFVSFCLFLLIGFNSLQTVKHVYILTIKP